MKKLFVLVIILLISLPVTASADEATRRQLAEQFLTINQVKEQVDLMYQKVSEIVNAQLEAIELPEKREKNLEAMRKISADLLAGSLSWDSLKDEYITLYADTFTEKELQGIIDFSKSPLGQKMAEKSPILMQKSMEIGRQHAQEVMPKVQKAIQDYLKANVKAPAAKDQSEADQPKTDSGQAPTKK